MVLEQLPNNAIATTKAKGRNKCLPSFIVVRIGFVVCKITPYFLNEQENGKVIELKPQPKRFYGILFHWPPTFDVRAATNTLTSYSIHMGKATSSRVKTSDVGVMTAAATSTTTTACLR